MSDSNVHELRPQQPTVNKKPRRKRRDSGPSMGRGVDDIASRVYEARNLVNMIERVTEDGGPEGGTDHYLLDICGTAKVASAQLLAIARDLSELASGDR